MSEENKIAELRSKLRKAMQTGSTEASNCCRELITALKAEDLNAWEPELCLLLLEMPHLRPEQIPEKVEKLYFDLSYLRAELPSLSSSADEGSPETVRRLGFSGPYAAFQEVFRWINQFAESNAVTSKFLNYSTRRLELGLIGPDGLETACRVFALYARINEMAGDVHREFRSLHDASSAYSAGMQFLGLADLRKHSRSCEETYQSLRRKYNAVCGEIESEQKQKEKARKAREQSKAKKRLADYWQEHAEEKASLEAEQTELKAKAAELDQALADLENDPDAVAHGREYDRLSDREEELMKQRERMNIFQGGKKRAIEQELVTVREAKWAAKEKRDKESEEKEAKRRANRSQFAEIERRLSEIKKELTKPR